MGFLKTPRLPRAPQPKRNLLSYLPKPLSWFLGYRSAPTPPLPRWLGMTSVFLITMGAMLVNFAVAMHAPLFTNYWRFTALVPSYAASCVLIYDKLQAPLSQPRNLVFGHFISALVGVCIMKLFMTNENNEQYLWISGALSVALSSVIMDVTGTTHPPSGATALLPSVDDAIRELGWNYLPAVLIFSCLFLAVALLGNNLGRRYPLYWVSPPAPPKPEPTINITAKEFRLPPGLDLSDSEQAMVQSLQKKLANDDALSTLASA